MTQISDEILRCERDAELARERLRSSIEQLKQNLSPGVLAHELMSTGVAGGGTLMTKFAHAAKKNPLPVFLIGLGAAILMGPGGDRSRTSGRTAEDDAEIFDRGARRLKSGPTPPLAKASENLSSRSADAAHSIAETTSDGAPSSSRRTKGRAGAVGSSLSGARKSLSHFIDEQPLVFAAICAAAGAALGAALPATRTGKRFFGADSESVKGAAAENSALETIEPDAESGAGGEAPRSSRYYSSQASREASQAARSSARGFEGRTAGGSRNRRAV